MTDPVQTIIGFDLGHGEMALAQQALTGRAEPEIVVINGKRSQITGLNQQFGQQSDTLGRRQFRQEGSRRLNDRVVGDV